MKVVITNPHNPGFKLADVSTFSDGSVHSVQGPLATKIGLRSEADLMRYAKDNNLTISFSR